MLRVSSRTKFSYFLLALLLSSVFTSVQLIPAIAQKVETKTNTILAQLHLTPSTIESGKVTRSPGYINIVNSTGFTVLAPRDLEITLSSQDPTVASVPTSVVIPKDHQYARFDINVGTEGETEISAIFQDQIISQKFIVVGISGAAPTGLKIQINLPTTNMNVNTQMPVSVSLQTTDGTLIVAPKDIEVLLDYERSLIKLDDTKITIKEGTYYGLTTVRTLGQVGNAFIRATATGEQTLSAIANFQVSAELPTKLKIYVFPGTISRAENNIDIFVGLLDIFDLPTFAVEDVKLNLFSDSTDISNNIRKLVQEGDLVIKKNEFGLYVRMRVFFDTTRDNIVIGASAPSVESATTTLTVVEPLPPRDLKAVDQKLTLFTVREMPTDAKAIAVYQLNAVEHDKDDCPDFIKAKVINSTISNKCAAKGFRNIQPIDLLPEGALYPIESDFINSKEKPTPLLNVQSSDVRVLKIGNVGRTLNIGSSYGTSIVSTTTTIPADATVSFKKTAEEITPKEEVEKTERTDFQDLSEKLGIPIAEISISATLQGTGVAQNSTFVVSRRTTENTMIFSPAGEGKMVFNKEGYSDLFVITLDSSRRPIFSRGLGYLISPFDNSVVMKPEESFTGFRVHTSLVSDALQKGSLNIKAAPIGTNARPSLVTESTFQLIPYLGTRINIITPFKNLVGFSGANPIGVVQLKDSFGNPVLASSDLTIKLDSSDPGVVQVPSTIIIAEGRSFVEFPVTTFSKLGNSTISASAQGLFSSQAQISSILVELPASFLPKEEIIRAAVAGNITISTLEGTTVLWGAPADIEIVSKDDKATTYDATTDSYLANLQIIPKSAGDFAISVSLLKDGYQTKKVSETIHVEPFLLRLNLFIESPPTSVQFNQTTSLKIFVDDANAESVVGALLQLKGQNMTATPTSLRTGEDGSATVLIRAISGPTASLNIHASKEAYVDAEETLKMQVAGFQGERTFFGLPPWILYVGIAGIVGGIAVVVLVVFRKPKELSEEEEEAI